jgi:hypothetical protein
MPLATIPNYTEARASLESIRRGYLPVPEWTEPTAIQTAKIELQTRTDVVAGWEDEEKFEAGDEHDEDIR